MPGLIVPLVLGFGLILVTLLDVVLTALHVQTESPFSTRLNRADWWLLVRLSRLVPGRARDEVLGWALPVMLGTTMLMWALGYILGFALVYLPFVHDPSSVHLQSERSAIEDALFLSGVTFFSIGSSEINPVGPFARALTVMEGGAGLLTISLAVTYLLNVYPVLSRKVAVADTLNQVTGGRADGVLAARRYLRGGHAHALMTRIDRLTDELIFLAHAHRLYPVLYYVRSREVHESFVRILALAQGLVSTLRYMLDEEAYRNLVGDPRLLLLEESLLDTLHLLARSSHLTLADPSETPPPSADFDHLRAALLECGLRAVPPDPRLRARFARLRDATEPYIHAYARNIGYAPEEVWATYDRRARETALRSVA